MLLLLESGNPSFIMENKLFSCTSKYATVTVDISQFNKLSCIVVGYKRINTAALTHKNYDLQPRRKAN